MALPILDGNQSATTLSSILTSGEHIPAHTVVSLGTQAITDMRGAVSGSVVSISNFPATQPVSIASVTIGNTVTIAGTVTANPTGTQTIAGTVTANLAQGIISESDDVGSGAPRLVAGVFDYNGTQFGDNKPFPISGTVTANVGQILVRDDVAGTVTSGYLPVGTSAWSGQSGAVVVMGGADDGAVPAHLTSIFGLTFPIAGTVTANTFALQGTAVTTSDFTSTTASTLLAGFNATREVLTIFNEGAGNLHICAGATCTTIAYQVRLSAGDYYEVPNHQTTVTHSAVFATAGTARVTQVS